MQCKEFANVIEQQGLSSLPATAQDHLASCTSCQDFFADLNSIVAVAGQLPVEADPPQRIWVSLHARLEAEGLIKEPSVVAGDPSANWLQNFLAWFTPRSLATAGAGIALAFAAFLQLHKPNPPATPTVFVAKQQVQSVAPSQVTKQEVASVAQPKPGLTVPKKKSLAAALPAPSTVLAPPPSLDVYQARSAALNQAENEASGSGVADNPALDEALRKNLRTVNGFIAECEAHLKKHPQDMLAREYLNSAYQQKAELLAAILDSGRSEQ